MIWLLDKQYVIPSRTYFAQVATPEVYKKHKAQVDAQLLQVEYHEATMDTVKAAALKGQNCSALGTDCILQLENYAHPIFQKLFVLTTCTEIKQFSEV